MIKTAYIAGMWIILVCITAFNLMAHTQSAADTNAMSSPSHLYQVVKYDETTGKERFGFIDNTGKLVIDYDRLPETTDHVGEFRDGLALIQLKKDGKSPSGVGFIDQTGKMAIEPKYIFARGFSDGMAYVSRKGFTGFIDQHGKEVAKLSDTNRYFYDSFANDFHEGLAAVWSGQVWGKKWGFIDRSGKLVIDQKYAFVDDFSEGLAGVVESEGGRYGFINQKGEMVIAPRFEPRRGTDALILVQTSRFSEGLALVKLNGLYGYINSKGDFVIPPQFNMAREFSEGLAWVMTDKHKIGWINKSGQWVVTRVDGNEISDDVSLEYSYQTAGSQYSEGLVPIALRSKNKYLFGYIDQRSAIVIQPGEIYNVGTFIGGIAKVSFFTKPGYQGEKMGYIDTKGQFIWRQK